MKFRKKPVVIEAVQWNGNNLKEVIDLIGLHESANKWTWEEYEEVVKTEGLKIFTLEGTMMANISDWIILGVNNEAYPCKNDIFEKTYEKVD
jgi:preprotein translocase subunit Sss1